MGIKETANTFHLSRNTVRKYVRLFISSGKTTEQLLELSEEHLREMFGCTEFRHRELSRRQLELEALIPSYVARLSRKGMTVRKLFNEYRSEHPDGFQESVARRLQSLLRYTRTPAAANTTAAKTNPTTQTVMETTDKTAPATQQPDQNTTSLDLMNRMKMHGMAEAFRESLAGTTAQSMTPDSFLSMLLHREWDWRAQAAVMRLTKNAAFRYKAYLEEIDYATNRGLDRNQMERLATLDFVRNGQNLFITGSSGTGMSFLACALGHEACKRGIRTLYANASKLLGQLKVAKVKNNLESELKKIERCQLLILDDLFLVPLDAKERPILLDIIEDRHERKSIIITSQYPSSSWYDMVGDPTVADAILDRIVHSAHSIELTGESMRKLKARKV